MEYDPSQLNHSQQSPPLANLTGKSARRQVARWYRQEAESSHHSLGLQTILQPKETDHCHLFREIRTTLLMFARCRSHRSSGQGDESLGGTHQQLLLAVCSVYRVCLRHRNASSRVQKSASVGCLSE